MRTRTYGSSGPLVVVLHGGPGTPGSMAPVARALATSFRVLEPLQRGASDVPLTVERHVRDLHELIGTLDAAERPALVGHSWGAMLALAHAATHPDRVGSLVLIGCGTFDSAARRKLQDTLDERTDSETGERLRELSSRYTDPDQRLAALGELILPLYSHDLEATDQQIEEHDARAHQETWDDMVDLQDRGIYPAAFAAIESPVLMLHGSDDPHPGRLVQRSLLPLLPQLEYREWERCGHYPWLERAAASEFFETLADWLMARSRA